MDKIASIRGSVVQHGRLNSRVYVMRMNVNDACGLIPELERLAKKKGYGKICAKIPVTAWKEFESAGYITEAVVPGLFKNRTDGYFVAKYLSPVRRKSYRDRCLNWQRYPTADGGRHPGCSMRVEACTPLDAGEMGAVYRQVFESYPFPIQEPAYLRRMMKEDVLYFCVRVEGHLASLAAAEIDPKNRNCEMTDFATLPEFRRQGFARALLGHMEATVRRLGIHAAYTIARAASLGMNAVFKNSGYRYAGILKNNSHICGSIQSMTVWYKHLPVSPAPKERLSGPFP
jgi:putative beta-lysine N-acetyltransferase